MAEKSITDRLKDRAKEQVTKDSNAELSPKPPADGGPMSAERGPDPRGEGSKDRNVAASPKSLSEKQAAAEEKIARAKAEDQEDTREETSGDERHDLVSGKEINIPPTIQQERLRMGQNPATGEPWTREERMRYDKETEQARQKHAEAVRESEIKMRDEQAKAQAPIQPVPHVPTSFLTEDQKKAMQESQDRGEGPIAQAHARDSNSPDELGKAAAERRMAEKEKEDLTSGVDPEVEKDELEGDNEEEQDADEVQKDLDKHRNA